MSWELGRKKAKPEWLFFMLMRNALFPGFSCWNEGSQNWVCFVNNNGSSNTINKRPIWSCHILQLSTGRWRRGQSRWNLIVFAPPLNGNWWIGKQETIKADVKGLDGDCNGEWCLGVVSLLRHPWWGLHFRNWAEGKVFPRDFLLNGAHKFKDISVGFRMFFPQLSKVLFRTVTISPECLLILLRLLLICL